MARLIVDEGGEIRRFRLKDGRLSIGSGEGAALSLPSSDLDELHAYLVVRGGEATLEFPEGAFEPMPLEPGETVELGGVLLTVEDDDPAAPATRPAPVKRSSRPARRSAGASGRSSSRPRSGSVARRASRRPTKRGTPTWLLLALLGGIGFGGWKAFQSYADYAGERGFDIETSYNRVVSRLEERDFAGALREYEKIDAQTDLDPEWRATFDELKAKAETLRDEAGAGARYVKWSKDYLEPQLRRFEREYLKGEPDPPRVRVFLKRIAYFKEHCPGHPEMDWVDRMQERYARIVDLDDPPTLADVEFEVKSLTWAKPRDYKQAFEVLDEFLDTAEGSDRERGLEAYDALAAERQAHFEDRLAQAKYDWERGNHRDAVLWLVLLVRYSGDEDMANDAASRLVRMGEIDDYLRGYAQEQPETWAELLQNPIIAEKAAAAGI